LHGARLQIEKGGERVHSLGVAALGSASKTLESARGTLGACESHSIN
jgi:hypothetical protein